MHWDETWTPGANWATTLDVDKNVKVNGMPVAKGKYSVWMVVRKTGDWTVVLDPKATPILAARQDLSQSLEDMLFALMMLSLDY